MTILTIITNANDQTVYFEKPIERGFEYIRLVSCSLFNSWYNLKERGEIGFVENSITTTKIIPPGNYSLSSIGKKMNYLKENTSQSNLMTHAVQLSSKIHITRKLFSIVT